MDRKLFGIFSGTHLTLLGLGAMFIPSALYATVTTTAVSITDPNTGAKSYVDPGRKLWVFDPVAGYANNPQNYVRIFSPCGSSSAGNVLYTPPSGKALIIKSVHFSYESEATSENLIEIYNATTNSIVTNLVDTKVGAAGDSDLGSGYFVRGG